MKTEEIIIEGSGTDYRVSADGGLFTIQATNGPRLLELDQYGSTVTNMDQLDNVSDLPVVLEEGSPTGRVFIEHEYNGMTYLTEF